MTDYETITNFCINHIKKTFKYGNDIAKALEGLKEVDLTIYKPNLQVSVETDKELKSVETEQCKMEFQVEYEAY